MKTIFKYCIDLHGTIARLPEDAQILTVSVQDNRICLWALVDTNKPNIFRSFVVYGTGQDMTNTINRLKYIGTVHINPFVWHIFEVLGSVQ